LHIENQWIVFNKIPTSKYSLNKKNAPEKAPQSRADKGFEEYL